MKHAAPLLMAVLFASPAAAQDSWRTAMTPLDSRAPLPKPSEPDADADNSGPFRSPAPAVIKASAKRAKPAAKPAAPKAEPAKPGCKCEPCECGAKPVATAAAPTPAPAVDPRLTRDAAGYYYGTAPTGQSYYSTDPNAVLRMIQAPTVAAPYCTTGTCPR